MHNTIGMAVAQRPSHELHRLGDVIDELLGPLVELEEQVHRSSDYYDEEPWQAENFCRELPGKRELSLVATVSGQPIGFVIASRRPDGAHIHRVATDPNHQGTGTATRLLACLLERTSGTVTLICDPRNRPARALYARAGFRVTGATPEGKLSLATRAAPHRRAFPERKT